MIDIGFGIELDTWDTLILAAIAIGTLYYIYTTYLRKPAETDFRSFKGVVPVSSALATSGDRDEGGWIQKMKNSGRNVAIFYGSQTGTGEELAGRLAKDAKRYGLKAIVLDPEECNMEDLIRLTEIEQSLVIFCLATYGEGDPTDNAQQLHEYLQSANADLTGVKYAVFGLGNKTYEHFNEMGKECDVKMEKMGAERVYALGMGDDDGSLEEDFMRWREGFWPAVCTKFGVTASGEDVNMRNYRLELIEPGVLRQEQLFSGEMARLGSYVKQRPPFDQKNLFLSTVVVNRELHQSESERSCRHIEFDLTGSRLRYEAGDHVGIFATNATDVVNRLVNLLNVDVAQQFKLINLDEESSKKHPFPCPTTYGVALTHYVDICSPLKNHVLRELASHTSDDNSRQRLLDISNPSDESLKAYNSYILTARRSIIDILEEHPSCRPPIDLLLEMLPRLQVRYYSISSSPRVNPDRLSVTSVVVDYKIGGRQIKGVCTNYLKDKLAVEKVEDVNENTMAQSKVTLFIRKSTLRLPHRLHVPVIMIGPGTGFAPFRGFIQDRHSQRQKADPSAKIGEMVLYFGCRRREEDFIYEDEISFWKAEKTLTEVHVAFSRNQEHKVYVQHLLWQNAANTWDLIEKHGAHVYICGDARNMAQDVMKTFYRICREHGGKSEAEAVDYMKKMEQTKRYQADVWS